MSILLRLGRSVVASPNGWRIEQILHITFICCEYPPLPHGGIGTFVHTLANGLQRRGHQISVVGLGDKETHWKDGDIEVFVLPNSKIPYVGNTISRLRLQRWLKDRVTKGEVDIVETPEFLGMLPFGLWGCPVVVRLHQSSTAICLRRGQRIPKGIALYEELTLRMNSVWAAVSNNIYTYTCEIFGIQPGRVRTIYSPVPLSESRPAATPQLPVKFLFSAGQVSRTKGVVELAEAARELMNSHADLHLVYAGGHISAEDPVPISQQILDAMGSELSGRVHFLGHIEHSQVLECMAKATVYVFPSRLEAFGMVILEAMHCGVPVVCSSYPPGPEIITDGFDGLLADPTSPSDLVEKISRILQDPNLAEWLTANAKRTVERRFSLEKCVAETESFYGECLSTKDTANRSFVWQLFLSFLARCAKQYVKFKRPGPLVPERS
jgi:glycosyltransferase involved in cell wall biosynthesis